MSESKSGKSKKNCDVKNEKNVHVLSVNFYGALKSKNEIYFQMASLFNAVSQDGENLENKWIEKILPGNPPDISGKYFINNI